jgi:hypothetical protein
LCGAVAWRCGLHAMEAALWPACYGGGAVAWHYGLQLVSCFMAAGCIRARMA